MRRLLLALLCAGLLGTAGCKRTFHAQQSHAIGGGTIGKGWAAPPVRRVEGRRTAAGVPDPLGGLFEAKPGKRNARAGKPSAGGSQRKTASAKRQPSRKSSLSEMSSPFARSSTRRTKSPTR